MIGMFLPGALSGVQVFDLEKVYSVGLNKQSTTLAFLSSFQMKALTGLPEVALRPEGIAVLLWRRPRRPWPKSRFFYQLRKPRPGPLRSRSIANRCLTIVNTWRARPSRSEPAGLLSAGGERSEERRVGKECRSRWS